MRYRLIILTLFYVLTPNAFASLELELTQGIDGAWPIAVLPFEGQDKATKEIADVIMSDLQYSGRFRVLDNQELKQNPKTHEDVHYDYWKKVGADNLVLGHIKMLRRNHYEVIYELLDVLGNKHVLASKKFETHDSNFRSLAHHMSDEIYQHITGDKGIFSTRIAYIVVQRKPGKDIEYHLKIADADGYNEQILLTSNEPLMSPAWAPDGQHMAFVSFENKRAEIYIIDIVNGHRELVSSFPRINGAPAWSPDGKQLALVLSKSGRPKLYLMDLKSKHLTQLTKGWSIETEPSFAPDGKSIVFTSSRGGKPQVYQLSLSDKQIKRVTYKGNYNARASFSADGKIIAMLHREGSMFNIATQVMKNGRIRILTKTGLDESPSISPNGKMILYATYYGGSGVLGVVSTDGRVRLRLPSADGDGQEPAWSPYL